MKVKVEFKKLYEDSILPKKAHESDAGFDLYTHSVHGISLGGSLIELDFGKYGYPLAKGSRVLIKTGFGMSVPLGYEAQIRPRSGFALKNGISVVNSPGTIDSSFRNEVGVILINLGYEFFYIKKDDRIAQMVIQKLPEVEVVEVDELSNPSERGMAGFGSTGS